VRTASKRLRGSSAAGASSPSYPPQSAPVWPNEVVAPRHLALATPGARRRLGAVVATLLAITATTVSMGLVVARLLAGVIAGEPLADQAPLVAAVVVLQAARSLLVRQRRVLAARAANEVRASVRARLARALVGIGPARLSARRTGEVTSVVVDGIESLDPYVALLAPQATAAVIGAAATVAVIAVIDPPVALVIAACSVAAAATPRLSRRMLRSRYRPWWDAYSRLYADNLDALQGMATLKGLNASRRRAEELAEQAEQFRRHSTRLNAVVLGHVGVVALLVGGGSAAAIALASLHRAAGALTNAELFAVLLLTRECFRPVRDLQDAYHASYAAVPAARAAGRLLADTGDDHHALAEGRSETPALPARPAPEVAFEHVSFTYPERDAPAVADVSFRVPAGRTTALVGRSGAGKSTLVSLLARLVEPQAGRVLVGGQDLAAMGPAAARAQLALVAQDAYLFHGTVRDNLRLGRPGATDAEVEAAAAAAGAHPFIAALPGGYDALVGERGLTLSGGERQRIAIARALLRDAPVLVLDEATSSLDGRTEAELRAALGRLAEGRTTLVVAHRLSTARAADEAVVLDGGRTVEAGPPARLIEDGGHFARLFAGQLRARRAGDAPPSSEDEPIGAPGGGNGR